MKWVLATFIIHSEDWLFTLEKFSPICMFIAALLAVEENGKELTSSETTQIAYGLSLFD